MIWRYCSVVCDGCLNPAPVCDGAEEARAVAKNLGWTRGVAEGGKREDRCPDFPGCKITADKIDKELIR